MQVAWLPRATDWAWSKLTSGRVLSSKQVTATGPGVNSKSTSHVSYFLGTVSDRTVSVCIYIYIYYINKLPYVVVF